jgi:Flp pilus assembly protein TadD
MMRSPRAVLRAAALAALAAVVGCASGGRQVRGEADGSSTNPHEYHRSLAMTFLKTDQAGRAIGHAQTLVRLLPRDPEPRTLLARAYMSLRLWHAARAVLEEAIDLDQGFAPAPAMLAVLLDATGEHREAERWHRRAIHLDGSSAAYHNNLGFGLYLQGRDQAALEALRDGLRLDARMRRLHNNLGFVYGRLGRFDEAFEHFRLAGPRSQATNNLGLVHEERGDLEAAHDLYLEALRHDPDLAEAHGNLGRVCEELGRPVPPLHAGVEPR